MFTPRQETLNNLLKQVRLEAGLTQRELAAKLETDHSRISDYEHGQRRMDLIEMETYCRAVGITLTDFVRRFEETE